MAKVKNSFIYKIIYKFILSYPIFSLFIITTLILSFFCFKLYSLYILHNYDLILTSYDVGIAFLIALLWIIYNKLKKKDIKLNDNNIKNESLSYNENLLLNPLTNKSKLSFYRYIDKCVKIFSEYFKFLFPHCPCPGCGHKYKK